MVNFNDSSFSITIEGDKDYYLATIEALLDCIAQKKEDYTISNHYICTLIKDMLPSWRQIISLEDVEFLNKQKKKI